LSRFSAYSHWKFIALFVFTTGLYLAILFSSQSHVDGDEAVVGIMAKHIMDKGERPIFFYAQPYAGGAAIEAYLAAIPFLLFGISSISLKLIALIFALLTIIFTYIFCLRHLDHRAALFSAVFLCFATPLIEWHFKIRGGYAFLFFSSILLFLLFADITYRNRRKPLNLVLMGFFSGLSYYNMELIIPTLATLFVASLYWKDVFWRKKPLLFSIAGLLVGMSPLIYFNLTHQLQNLKFIMQHVGGIQRAAPNILFLFLIYLPRVFVGQNAGQFLLNLPLAAYIEYILFTAVIMYAALKNSSSLTALLKGIFSRYSDTPIPHPIALVLLFLIIHVFVDIFSIGTGRYPRYFISFFPLIVVILGHATASLIKKPKILSKFAAAALLVFIPGLGLYNHISYIRPCLITDDV
jgi:hypothetical protein